MSKPEIPESIITPTYARMVPFAFKAPPELVERLERYHAKLVELVREKAPMVDVTKGDAARYVFERGLDAIDADNPKEETDAEET